MIQMTSEWWASLTDSQRTILTAAANSPMKISAEAVQLIESLGFSVPIDMMEDRRPMPVDLLQFVRPMS